MKFTRKTWVAVSLCAVSLIQTIPDSAAGFVIYSDNYGYRTNKNGNGQALQYLPYDPEDPDTFGPEDSFYLDPETDMPAVGLRPDDSFMVRLQGNFNAIPIAPNYLIAVKHQVPDYDNPDSWKLKDVFIGRDNQAELEVKNVEINAGLDLVVLKLGTIDPNQPPTPLSAWAEITVMERDFPGLVGVIGGYGPQAKRVINNGIMDSEDIPHIFDNGSNPKGNLAWALKDVDLSITAPFYYRAAITGDSGSGDFVQHGWNWYYDGLGGDSELFQVFQDFILTSIRNMEGDENYVIPTPPTSLPDPTNVWDGSDSSDWTDPDNWLSAAIPGGNDIVRVAHATQPAQLTSESAQVAELYIGAGGVAGTVLVSASASLDVDRSIYIGPEVADTGLLIVSGASLAAANINIGVYGEGTFAQTAGTVDVEGLFYVGKFDGSTGTAAIGTTSTTSAEFNAATIVVGDKPGSSGELFVGRVSGSSQPYVTAQWLVVGNHGEGVVRQTAESTVTMDRLLIGYQTDSEGAYELTGNGELNTGETAIGITGNGTFYQTAGTHNTNYLNIYENGTYTLDGGTLNVIEAIAAQGTIDFGGGELVLSGIADFTATTMVDADEADLTVSDYGLLILPEDFDIETQMPGLSVDSTSTAHVEGSGPVVIENGRGVEGFGTIRDDVVLQGDAFLQAAEDQIIRLRGNLTIEDDGVANLGLVEPSLIGEYFGDLLGQPGRDFTFDLNDGSLHVPALLAKDGYTLTANGSIVTLTVLVQNGATLEIGPDVDDLTIDGLLSLASDSTLKMDIAGLEQGQYDSLALTSQTATSSFSGTLELNFVDDFVPQSGQTLTLITYEQSSGEFSITHNSSEDDLSIVGTYDAGSFSLLFRLAGDTDLDGDVDGTDYAVVIDKFGDSGTWNWGTGDFDGDGDVDSDDLIAIQDSDLASFSWADFNGDGYVDGADFSAFLGYWGEDVYDPGTGPGDFNRDGSVDGADNSYFLGQWTGGPPGLAFIPEPASLSLLTLAACWSFRRKSPVGGHRSAA